MKKEPQKVGYDLSFFSKDVESERLKGFLEDLSLEIEKGTDIRLELLPRNWNALLDDLDRGNVSFILSSIEERMLPEGRYCYSNPIYPLGPVLASLPSESPLSLDSLKGKRVSLFNDVDASFLISKYPEVNFVFYSSVQDALQSLLSREVSAILLPYPQAIRYRQELSFQPTPLTTRALKLIGRKEKSELIRRIDDVSQELHESGKWEDLLKKWGV